MNALFVWLSGGLNIYVTQSANEKEGQECFPFSSQAENYVKRKQSIESSFLKDHSMVSVVLKLCSPFLRFFI